MSNEPNHPSYVWASGGLLALSVNAVIQLLQVKPLTNYLLFSLIIFSAIIPLLTLCFSSFNIDEYEKPATKYKRFLTIFVIACIAAFIGLFFIIFHLNNMAGVIFLISGFISIYVLYITPGKK